MKEVLSKELLDEIVQRLVEEAHPEKIVLFGSHAYGEPDVDSDIDLIVIEDEVSSKWEESVRLRGLLKDILIPMDIIVVKSEEFEFYAENWINSIFAEAKHKGKVLYDRASDACQVS